jgi:hypothetical protein
MGNIKNFNFNKLKLRLSNSDYWDFFLAADDSPLQPSGPVVAGECLVVWYDFNEVSIYPNSATTASTIYSLVSWNKAVNSGYTFSSFGLTGIDNGFITFEKDPFDPTNQNLVNALTGTTLVIPSGDTRLMMHLVTGTTEQYVYPTERIIDPTFTIGDYIQLCGGFYQGYYKIDGSTYEVLPTRVNNAWVSEFWLNPQDICSPTSGTILNDVYPNNKGFFFYMGTRAENKFWNQFYGSNTGCTSGCTVNTGDTSCSGFTGSVTTWCTVPKEKDITIIGDYGFGIPLNPPRVDITLVTNPFLIYGRAYDSSAPRLSGGSDTIIPSGITNTITGHRDSCGSTNIYGYLFNAGGCDLTSNDGLGTKSVCSYDGNGISVGKTREVLSDFQNPFLIYGRGSGAISGCSCSTCCGPNDGLGSETVCSYSGKTSQETEIDYNLDIIDNAIGFRITDDGRIGYRMLTVTGTCYTTSTGQRLYTSGVTIQEGYSQSGMVTSDSWSYIAIRYVTDYKNDCDLKITKRRTGKLMFYVNARLKYVVNDFPEFMAKRLDEYKAKQVGVPFNFSLGGGSQGLIDSQTFDGLDQADRGLPIEENFAGSFIGGISQFKFNICDLNYSQILYNYISDATRYGIQDTNLLLTEDAYLLLQQSGYGMVWV